MKNSKYLLIILMFIPYALKLHSQSPCGAGYGFTSSYTYNCTYTFTPSFPRGHPCIAYLSWGISSSGTYGRQCERINSDTLAYTHSFCFYGDQDVTMFIRFCDSSSCYVTHTINVVCTGSLICNPDPGNDSIPDPLVEITYKGINYDCGNKSGYGFHECMWTPSGGTYLTACAWDWAIRIVPSPYDCEFWTYHLQWVDYSSCDSVCQYIEMIPDHIYCITARITEGIVIWADANHCCFPDGYQRGFLWYPTPTSAGITDPDVGYDWGVCAAYRCPTSGSCTEDQMDMDDTALPTTHCPPTLKGGQTYKLREHKSLDPNIHIQQDLVIYNVEGKEAFKGNWKFSEQGSFRLKWPNGLASGMYFVKFSKSSDYRLSKLYKF